MNLNKRTIAITTTALATVGLLTACSSGGSSWEKEVRASVNADWNTSTDAENTEGCEAMELLGLDTPEAMTAFIMPMAGDLTPEDYADMGIPLGSDALKGVDTEEIILVAADEMVNLCNFSGVPKASSNLPDASASPAPATEVGEDGPNDYAQTAPSLTPVGTPVQVGDWDVTITSVDTNVSDKTVRGWDEYNTSAKGQYVYVEWSATYNGDERNADTYSDLTFSFYGADGTVYSDAGVFNPIDAEGFTSTVRPGGTVSYAATFDVPAAALAGGFVEVEFGYNGSDYADFATV